MLLAFNRSEARARGRWWNAFDAYSPERAMRAFACVFLHGGKCASRELLPSTPASNNDPCASCSDYASAFAPAKKRPW